MSCRNAASSLTFDLDLLYMCEDVKNVPPTTPLLYWYVCCHGGDSVYIYCNNPGEDWVPVGTCIHPVRDDVYHCVGHSLLCINM